MFIIAGLMDAMATEHEDHRMRRRKHIIPAYRTIAIGDTLDAPVRVLHGH